LQSRTAAHILESHVPGEWDEGLRAFRSWADGLKALTFDLETKCSGQSRTHLDPEGSLKNLLNMWGIKVPRKAVTFLRRALEDETIEASTPVEWFLGDRAIKLLKSNFLGG